MGIWHETYRIRAGEYEAIYNGMAPRGLGKVGRLIPARSDGIRPRTDQRQQETV